MIEEVVCYRCGKTIIIDYEDEMDLIIKCKQCEINEE